MGTAHAIFVEVLPEVTWPEKPEVSSAHARIFPRFFSYYSSTKCDRQGYQKWDQKESDLPEENMKRHFDSRHENMKSIPPPPKETGYDYTPPPPPKGTGYDYSPPPPRGPELSSLQHQTETEESYFMHSTGDPFVF
jgi:hypothetical protein